MKTKNPVLTTFILLFAFTSTASAVNFTPGDRDLADLDHYQAIKWGINYTRPAGQTITEMTITIANIRNWQREDNKLFIHLLDSAPTGLTIINDDPHHTNAISDYFSGQGILLTTFIDTRFSAQTFTYSLSAAQLQVLNGYAANGNNFAFGFDADCHYYNDGVTVVLNTVGVPDAGSTLALMIIASLGLVAGRRRLSA
jgi:hypothetical protein